MKRSVIHQAFSRFLENERRNVGLNQWRMVDLKLQSPKKNRLKDVLCSYGSPSCGPIFSIYRILANLPMSVT